MRPALRHVPLGTVPFARASAIQSHLVARFLAAKADPAVTPPPPTLLTASFEPTYTLGRRERDLSAAQLAHLSAEGRALVVPTLRGGQTTFHGPGQLTAYLILDLKTFGLSPKCYIRLLENGVIATLQRYGIRGFTASDPGVWTSELRKICAVGVHMRRNVTSYGIGLNVDTDLWWFDRIVACGLEGKEATSFVREGVKDVGVDQVATVLAESFAEGLGVGMAEGTLSRVLGVGEEELRELEDGWKLEELKLEKPPAC